ncbi:MAG: hypothetical protein EOP04_25955, partial [Proteobacteria bacterium]
MERDASRQDLRLIALLGYFFSLRPQETLALRRDDLIAGKKASTSEYYQVLTAVDLYERLAVNITRQRGHKGINPPKRHSIGIVARFDEVEATAIVGRLITYDADAPLFPLHFNTYLKQWAAKGLRNMTMKDLRRASLYWLGHYRRLELVVLKNQTRHNKIMMD